MAKKRAKDYEEIHRRNIDKYVRQINAIYQSSILEASLIGASVAGQVDISKPFVINDYPVAKARIDKLVSQLNQDMTVTIVNGSQSEWTLANNKNNYLSQVVFGDNIGKLTQAQYRQYFSNNDKALESFLKRKNEGMNLSDRVWKYSSQFREEIELGLDIGIRNGLSAQQIARDLKQYLKEPDKLFRRVRDEHGQLHLSKQAQTYTPGRGVCRSSHKNAVRLARTETNMAYRTADHERWMQADYVVGFEVRRSNRPFDCPVCDALKGKYPKTFKFVGWHPNCRCYTTSILKTSEEMEAHTQKILNGEPTDNESVNKVYDVPDGFKGWVSGNKERIAKANYRGTTPYFLKDNEKYVDLGDFEISPTLIKAIDSHKEYLTYDKDKWRRDYFNQDSGGYVITNRERAEHSKVSKNERAKFKKEFDMAMVFAQNGHKVRILEEVPRISSPDVLIDGKLGDFKRISGHNNIVKEAMRATNKQGADIVLFQFDNMDMKVFGAIEALKKRGIRGMYFVTGQEKIIVKF